MSKLAKTALFAAAAAATFGAVLPAAAQTPGRANAIRAEIQQLQNRVNRSDFRNRISEREARALRADVQRLSYNFRAYNRNGLNNWEMRTLQQQINSVRARLQHERRDRDGRRG
jgi:hypothetical protein